MQQAKSPSGIFYGWWVVIACSLISLFSAASMVSFTMFFPVLLEDLGWTRTMLGFGLTLHVWVNAIIVIAVGFLVDKYNPKIVLAPGGILILIGLALTSTMNSVWQFYLYYGVILSIGVAATIAVPTMATARKWFIKKAGLAVALTFLGQSLGLALMAIAAPLLIGAFGWRNSYLILGLFFGIMIVLLSLIIKKDPESIGLLPDGETKPLSVTELEELQQGQSLDNDREWTSSEAIGTRSFWMLLFSLALLNIPVLGVVGHIATWGGDIGRATNVPAEQAAGLIELSVLLLAISNIVGAILGGALSDKIGRKPLICACLALDVIVLLFFVTNVGTLTGVIIASILMGLIGSIILATFPTYVGDIFGRKAMASILGILFFAANIIGGTGAVIFGWIYDTTGAYTWAWILSAIIMFCVFIMIFLTKREKKKA